MRKIKSKKSRDNNTFSPKYILKDTTPFLIQEAYKLLRTNLTYSLPGERSCMVFGITSSNRSDGKSVSALNLALSYASIGKKVLLIDCDLRCPGLAGKLRVKDAKSQPGLSEILIGKADLGSCVRTPYGTELDILFGGTIPPDATSLLESDEMGKLFEEARTAYEIIIVDLPPVLSVVDAAILARHLDGILLVVRHNVTRFDAMEDTIRQLRLVDARILGFLYNDAPLESKKYGSKYYYAYSEQN